MFGDDLLTRLIGYWETWNGKDATSLTMAIAVMSLFGHDISVRVLLRVEIWSILEHENYDRLYIERMKVCSSLNIQSRERRTWKSTGRWGI
jgi:hypothetical protein